jgi:hypothetical protein
MPKLKITRKHWLFSLLGLIIFSGIGYNYWRTHQVIPDYIPPLQTISNENKKASTIVAVGDISCTTKSKNFNNGEGNLFGCQMKDTAELTRSLKPKSILLLGDIQYEYGEYEHLILDFGAKKIYLISLSQPLEIMNTTLRMPKDITNILVKKLAIQTKAITASIRLSGK